MNHNHTSAKTPKLKKFVSTLYPPGNSASAYRGSILAKRRQPGFGNDCPAAFCLNPWLGDLVHLGKGGRCLLAADCIQLAQEIGLTDAFLCLTWYGWFTSQQWNWIVIGYFLFSNAAKVSFGLFSSLQWLAPDVAYYFFLNFHVIIQ